MFNSLKSLFKQKPVKVVSMDANTGITRPWKDGKSILLTDENLRKIFITCDALVEE